MSPPDKRATVLFTDSALADLREILDHLAQYSPHAVARIGHMLLSRAETLSEYPRAVRLIGQKGETEYRQIVVGRYILRYRVAERQTVHILSVPHGQMLQPSID